MTFAAHLTERLRASIPLALALALSLTSVTAAFAQQLSAREIMERADDYQRSTSDSAFNRMQLSTCRFGIKDGKITCAERPRVKALESVGKNYGPNLKDTKSITIVLEPAAERGIGMLSYSYDESDRDNETWLYLSALGRVKRIASGNSDDDSEPASLFGSEFTTEDTETGKLEEYTLTLLEETQESINEQVEQQWRQGTALCRSAIHLNLGGALTLHRDGHACLFIHGFDYIEIGNAKFFQDRPVARVQPAALKALR